MADPRHPLRKAMHPVAASISAIVVALAASGIPGQLGLTADQTAEILGGILAIVAIVAEIVERKAGARWGAVLDEAKEIPEAVDAVRERVTREGDGEGGEVDILEATGPNTPEGPRVPRRDG